MIIGIPAEIKSDEYRIAMLPVGAHLLSEDGHTVLVQKNAGMPIRICFPELPDNSPAEAQDVSAVASAKEEVPNLE